MTINTRNSLATWKNREKTRVEVITEIPHMHVYLSSQFIPTRILSDKNMTKNMTNDRQKSNLNLGSIA